MSTCQLTIYRTEITPQRNCIVDSLEGYLGTLTATYQNLAFQHQKLELDCSIKIAVDQKYSAGSNIGNYVRIYQDLKAYYYFITSTEWTAVNVVKLGLSMDTLNTFKNDFTFNDRTNVIREHRNRFEKKSMTETFNFEFTPNIEVTESITVQETSDLAGIDDITWTITSTGSDADVFTISVDASSGALKAYYRDATTNDLTKVTAVATWESIYPVVDFTSENINAPKYGQDVQRIVENDSDNWYIIYNTNSDTNKTVETYLMKDSPFTVKTRSAASSTIAIDANDASLTQGYYYYVPYWIETSYVGKASMYEYSLVTAEDVDGNNITTTYLTSGSLSPRREVTYPTPHGIVFTTNGTNISIYDVSYKFTGSGDSTNINGFNITNTITLKGITSRIQLVGINKFKIYESSSLLNNVSAKNIYDLTVLNTASSAYTETQVAAFNRLDRTQNVLIKIIQCPYCPVRYTIDTDGKYIFDDIVTVSTPNGQTSIQALRLPNSMQFSRTLDVNVDNPLYILSTSWDPDISITDDKSINNETKLYHSDFYQPKVVYDSFNLGLDIEKVDTTNNQEKLMNIEFDMSRTFSSTFMMKFNDYNCKYGTQDYNNILVANRNNELPLYNSDYLNYIRTGYNYDVKTKNRQNTMSAITTALQIAGAVASFAASGATGGASAAAGVALLTSATASIASGINSAIQSEQSINQKLFQYQNESTSISNCDNIDILNAYSGNKAKVMLYNTPDTIRNAVWQLLFNCGYATNLYKVPNTNNRTWFNYVQCEPVFDNESTTPYEHYLNDIKQRFSAGVTYYHVNNNTYDWDKEYENWETDLIE